jgi:hypothetical protein
MTAFVLAGCLSAIAVPATLVTASAQESSRPAVLTLPGGRVQPLPSPDGAHTLYGVQFQDGKTAGSQLWIRDSSTAAGRLLLTLGGSMQAFWSPDGKEFSVNDRWASDRESAYIYDTETLKRQNVGEDILAADPESRHFTNAHAYFHVERWDGPAQVIVRFHGHTDEAPVQCFELQYRVGRTGVVEKLSERVERIDSPLVGRGTCSE